MKHPIFIVLLALSTILLGILLFVNCKMFAYEPRKNLNLKVPPVTVHLKSILSNISKINRIAVVEVNQENQNSQTELYCQHFGYDHIQIPKTKDPKVVWQYMFQLLFESNYEHFLCVNSPSILLSPDSQKPLERLIDQSGDSSLIICRSELNHTKVNTNMLLFRKCEWSLFKCLQIYNNPEKIQKLLLHQVYTTFKHKSLHEAKNSIDLGFPYMLQCTCIYNEKAFDLSNNDKSVYPWAALPGFVEIPHHVPPRALSTSQQKIPKIIYQTMSTNLANNDRYKFSVQAWQEMNPDYSYRFFNAQECRIYIEKHFDKNVNKAYNMILPGAYQADFWRYCVLYIEGGCYVDSQTQPFLPFSYVINADTEFVSAIDECLHGLWQGLLCIVPQHPVLKLTIDQCVKNILKRKSFYSSLEMTGPMLLGKCVNKYLGRKPTLSFSKYPLPSVYKLLCHRYYCKPYVKIGSTIFLLNKYFVNEKQLSDKYTDINHISGKEAYGPAHINKRVLTFSLFRDLQ